MLFAVRVYQSFFSALMPSACKFYPSCSHYAAEAVRVHGARRGSWLALRRILRCHPFSPGGVDLVPDPGDFEHAETRAGCSSTGFSVWGLGSAGEKNPQAEACATKHAYATAPVVMLGEAKHLSSSNAEEQRNSSARSAPRSDKESNICVTSEACPTEVRS